MQKGLSAKDILARPAAIYATVGFKKETNERRSYPKILFFLSGDNTVPHVDSHG
jgi:hypothetical protein